MKNEFIYWSGVFCDCICIFLGQDEPAPMLDQEREGVLLSIPLQRTYVFYHCPTKQQKFFLKSKKSRESGLAPALRSTRGGRLTPCGAGVRIIAYIWCVNASKTSIYFPPLRQCWNFPTRLV